MGTVAGVDFEPVIDVPTLPRIDSPNQRRDGR
jgi:hypothetical protein